MPLQPHTGMTSVLQICGFGVQTPGVPQPVPAQ
jgi:hypothetical protein